MCVAYDPLVCTTGTYCPEGYTTAQACQAGFYCPDPSIRVVCPPNSYCPEGLTNFIRCPIYMLSPSGSISITQCKACQDNSKLIGNVTSTTPLSSTQFQCNDLQCAAGFSNSFTFVWSDVLVSFSARTASANVLMDKWFGFGHITKNIGWDAEINNNVPVILIRHGFSISPLHSYFQVPLTVTPGDMYAVKFKYRFGLMVAHTSVVNVTWSCDSVNWSLIFTNQRSKTNIDTLYNMGTLTQVFTDGFIPSCNNPTVRFWATATSSIGGDVSIGSIYIVHTTSYCKCNSNYYLDSDSVCQFACPIDSYCTGTSVNTCPADATAPALSISIDSCTCGGDKNMLNGACKCPDGYLNPDGYHNKFETLSDVNKVPNMYYSRLITDTSLCKSGNCAMWMDGYVFNTSVFPDPNVFSVSFWLRGQNPDFNVLLSISDPGKNPVHLFTETGTWKFSTEPGNWRVPPFNGPTGYTGNTWYYMYFTFSYGKISTQTNGWSTETSRQYTFDNGYKLISFPSYNSVIFFMDEMAFLPGVMSFSTALQQRNAPSLSLCNTCPENSYCVNETLQTACPVGLVSAAGSSVVDQCRCVTAEMTYNSDLRVCVCPVGMTRVGDVCVCAPGYYLLNGSCVQCPINTYTFERAQTSCISCPSNSRTLTIGSDSLDKCICNNGFSGEVGRFFPSICAQGVCSVVVGAPALPDFPASNVIDGTCNSYAGNTGPNEQTSLTINFGKTYYITNMMMFHGFGRMSGANTTNPICTTQTAYSSLNNLWINRQDGSSCANIPLTNTMRQNNIIFNVTSCNGAMNAFRSSLSWFLPAFAEITLSGFLNQCDACPANNYCTGTIRTPCPTGAVSPAGSFQLSQCTCHNAQQTIINNKCSCPRGRILSGGNCVTCPPGMVCAVSTDISATCSQGSYCPPGSDTETPCQAGSYCATPSTQVECPVNTYCPAGSTAPTDCPHNHVSLAGSTLSTQCETQQIEVGIGIEGAGVNLNETDFKRSLPGDVVLNSYEDMLVLSIGSCPRGYYCPPDTTTAIPCPASTYNNETHADTIEDCLTCPVGQYCPLASLLPTACPAGTYRITEGAAHSSDCTVCPSGNFCPLQSVTPTNCSAGTFGSSASAESIDACLACPTGKFCPVATTTPTACAAGSFRATTGGTQQEDCDVCPLGQFCPLQTTTPSDCAAGSYRGSVGGTQQGDCTVCPSGNFCPIKSVDPTNCSVSTYNPSNGGQSAESCLACPLGEYCPLATTTPVSCAAGSYRGSTGAGAQSDCAVCPTGNYCPIKSINPTNCSAGTYNPTEGQTSSAACLSCPAGEYCPTATTTPSECAANTFAAATGKAVCDQCPVYSTSPIASTNCTCDAGHYHVVSSSGGVSAQAFPITLTKKNFAGSPIAYIGVSGSPGIVVTKGTVVTFNAANYRENNVNKLMYIDLYNNLYKSVSFYQQKSDIDPEWTGVQYVDVIPYSYQKAATQQSAMLYSVGVSGSWTQTLVWDTTNVPSNMYYLDSNIMSAAPTSVFVASPTPVTITYSPSYYGPSCVSTTITAGCVGDTLVLKRPAGHSYYTTTPYQKIYVSCISSNDPGNPPNVVEMANSLSPLTWTIPVIDPTMECFVSYGPLTTADNFCPYSKIVIYPRPSAIGAATASLTCANCSSGYRSDPGAEICTECGLGYYSSPVSQTCTACPVGTKCPTATTPAPVNCGVGLYQSQSGQATCLSCPVGQYCDLDATVTPTDCPAGTFRSTEGAASLDDCAVCTPGSYCPVKSVDPTSCAAGSFQNETGGQSQDDCDACTVGNYCPVKSVTPTNCPSGTHRGSTGAQSVSDCAICTTGHFCPIQSVTPSQCVAGTYNPSTGGRSEIDCLACPVGQFCLVATTTPSDCAAGSYRGEPGAESQQQCAVCPSGNFCPVQSVNPTNCSAGTYNPSTGSGSLAACLSCPVGDFCPVASTNTTFCASGSYRGSEGATQQADCTVCPQGNFCPVRSVNPVNCSSGTFRPSTAGAAVSDCTVCATGKYSLAIASSTDCPLCPSNYYCANSTTIKTCPTHTSSTAGSSSLLHCRCDPGFKCAYSKRITALVTLNATTSTFNNNVGGIRTAFINAVADAAGVSSNQVTINSVVSKPTNRGGRRLLSADENFIDVFATVQGAERLHKLDFHLARHSATLHQGHSWQEAHTVISSAIRRGPIFST